MTAVPDSGLGRDASRLQTAFLPRDFVETAEGLIFAVVAQGLEDRRVLAFLRYVRESTSLRKVHTADAQQWVRQRHAHYDFYSTRRDVTLHGVPVECVTRHYRPAERLVAIRSQPTPDELVEKVRRVTDLLIAGDAARDWLGVTGSVLVGAHHRQSDIDLVVYGAARYEVARDRLRAAMEAEHVDPLSESQWREAYDRRGCSLSFEEYLWHERRKFNKCSLGGTKVDLSCVEHESPDFDRTGKKLCRTTITADVTDDTRAFHYPARYRIHHPDIDEIVCFNPTYTGQARRGELIEAAGWLEQAPAGALHLLVGTSRESEGEYIRVLRADAPSGPS